MNSASNSYNAAFLSPNDLAKLSFLSLGKNVLIHSTAILVGVENISIGNHVRIDPFTVLSAGTSMRIGSNVHIASHATIVGKGAIEIDDFAGISHGCKLLSSSDDFSNGFLTGPTIPDEFKQVSSKPIEIRRHAVVGANCVVLPGVQIGEGATIGALSLVKNTIPAWAIAAGTPTRIIGERNRSLVIENETKYLQQLQRLQ